MLYSSHQLLHMAFLRNQRITAELSTRHVHHPSTGCVCGGCHSNNRHCDRLLVLWRDSLDASELSSSERWPKDCRLLWHHAMALLRHARHPHRLLEPAALRRCSKLQAASVSNTLHRPFAELLHIRLLLLLATSAQGGSLHCTAVASPVYFGGISAD